MLDRKAVKAEVKSMWAILRSVLYGLPTDAAVIGIGVILTRNFGLTENAGLVLVAIGLVTAMLRTVFWPRSSATVTVPDESGALPMQSEIDAAYRQGLRVFAWFSVFEHSAPIEQTLNIAALRAQGYVVTDQNAKLIGAVFECHASPTQRRRAFRLVEEDVE